MRDENSPDSRGHGVVEQHVRHEAVGDVELARRLHHERVVENSVRDVSEAGDDT